MTGPFCQPAAKQYYRCLAVAGALFVTLLAVTLGLWRASLIFMDYRLEQASAQNSRQAIGRLVSFLDNRLIALRQVGHFYAHSEAIQQKEFEGFCSALMSDVPGIVAILATDAEGHPSWAAPPKALPLSSVYNMTADPKLNLAMSRAQATMQPSVTETLEVPEMGPGFLATAPVFVGRRHLGFVVGVFHYQSLLDFLLQPDLLAQYRLRISMAGWPVYPATPTPAFKSLEPARLDPVSDYGTSEKVMIGGQEWVISLDPIKAPGSSPTNFVSLTILALGLALSLMLTFLVYRWQWKALLFQLQARESESRLQRTGSNLAEIKSELDMIMNSVDEGIVIYNEQLSPVQANNAFLLTFEFEDEGRAMRSAHEHHEHMIQRVGSETKYWAVFNTLKNNPEQSYVDELEVPGKGGKHANPQRVFLRRAMASHAADGAPRGVLVVYKDMTRIKAMDRVKDEFLSNVTHELRSPLASIKGFAETMRRDPQMPAPTREEFISIILEEATRLHELIEELLDLRRMEAQGVPINPTRYDFRILVDDVIRSARTVLVSKHIAIKLEWSGLHGGAMQGDVTQISRALRNLLVNAVKYSPEGSEIQIHGHLGQSRVWLEITDQGAGIDDKDLPHIFDKFYRGSRQGRQKGTGLGLSIVKHIVELHGGHIGVRSEVGHGATFRVEFPRSFQPLDHGGTGTGGGRTGAPTDANTTMPV